MNKTTGLVFIGIGVLIVAAVFLAAPLHLASAGFGTKKIIGLAVGLVVLGIGLVGALSKRQSPKAS